MLSPDVYSDSWTLTQSVAGTGAPGHQWLWGGDDLVLCCYFGSSPNLFPRITPVHNSQIRFWEYVQWWFHIIQRVQDQIIAKSYTLAVSCMHNICKLKWMLELDFLFTKSSRACMNFWTSTCRITFNEEPIMIQTQVLGQDQGVRPSPFKASCHYWVLPMNNTKHSQLSG